ncbi:MAG: hypothetical protein Q9157_002561 [Trypethelium eluteriae]
MDPSKKERVWRTALASVPEATNLKDKDLGRLAHDVDVNGRQITNLVRTARAVSNFRKVPLTIETLKSVHEMNSPRDPDSDKHGS